MPSIAEIIAQRAKHSKGFEVKAEALKPFPLQLFFALLDKPLDAIPYPYHPLHDYSVGLVRLVRWLEPLDLTLLEGLNPAPIPSFFDCPPWTFFELAKAIAWNDRVLPYKLWLYYKELQNDKA